MPDCSDEFDPCLTIQHAVDVAVDGDVVHLEVGTYVENVVVATDVIIEGAGEALTTVDGGASGSVFFIEFGRDVMMSDMTITNGYRSDPPPMGGGGIYNEGRLTIHRTTVRDNKAEGRGDGILNMGGVVEITDSTIERNFSSAIFSSGIFNREGTLTLTRSTVRECTYGLYNDRVMPYFVGATHDARQFSAANFIYLVAMERGVEEGYRIFDFGRSRRENAGSFDFKRFHGFEPSSLGYQRFVVSGAEAPNISPSNPRYRLARRVWSHLPLWVTQPLGARIAKHRRRVAAARGRS